jgi:hypothetical protein
VRTVSMAKISCTQTDWVVSASVLAYEDHKQIFEKTWEKSIPRDMM